MNDILLAMRMQAWDDPFEHTNLSTRDLEAMRWLIAENERLRTNLKGWHDAVNSVIDEKDRSEAAHRKDEQRSKTLCYELAARLGAAGAEIAKLKREAACPCCKEGVNIDGDQCQGIGLCNCRL